MLIFAWVWGPPMLLTWMFCTWITTNEVVTHKKRQAEAARTSGQPVPNLQPHWGNIFFQGLMFPAYWLGFFRERWLLNG